MRKLCVLGFVLMLIVPAAQAGGFYVGGSLLDAGFDRGSVDDSDNGFKVWGGYNIIKWVGVEAAYNDFGEPSQSVGTVDSSAWSAVAKGTLPVGPVELFAKAGFYRWDVDFGALDDDGTDLGYGVGVAFVVIDKVEIRAEYELIPYDKVASGSDADVDVVSLGAGWRF